MNNDSQRSLEEEAKEILDSGSAATPSEAATPRAITSTAGKKILIVDDDDTLREIYAAVFSSSGFDVATAHDGQEAWELLQSGARPDALITGIIMPRMTGWELIAKMKADPALAKIPVAICSHRGLPEDEKKANELGANDFVVQNINPPPEVVRRIQRLLGGQDRFRISFLTAGDDAKALVGFLNRQQGTFCNPSLRSELTLEIEAEREKGKFKIRLIC